MAQAYHGRSAHAGISPSTHVIPAATSEQQHHEHQHEQEHEHEPEHPSTHPFHNPSEILVPAVLASHSHAEANRAHYDANAANYDKMEMANEVATQAARGILGAWDWTDEGTVCMDYACGTGLVSRQLAAHCKGIIGVDISQGMVDYYNTRVSNQGIPSSEMRAIRATLPDDPGELQGMQSSFDVVVCAQAYHHITDIGLVTQSLATFLRPGGALLVVDLVKSEHGMFMHSRGDAPEHVKYTVAHKGGLEEGEVRRCFVDAGLEEVSFEVVYEKEVEGRKLQMFLCKGVKPRKEA
ncbi:S-adenosyl-L-methionine-dependent methyltransferase [Dacryopinax primogenitus]|uniref:S-adenosyl-L-methionine-dependent methyltransferase n=1 Tax=Dacryopinax primogenitus (strain DJM 731) TaxID=1858805 RepID=M5GGN5_DACPD|nr:S-adenosyl-L-methionine-dependent methyltransferase [Dacryopinax primogenitus]EJU05798.1 S-adenosyl-L-methionine-dependent methyltransferase [Dacryopinax primogenitus]